ncbi:hypothetical protein AX17_002181 [Amanita inopinata Kibby_2008]|nr:hypothetical protein AX17_002181 [Amanita inopinata Kibby_2008]
MYSASNTTQTSLQSQQSSPPMPSTVRRSPGPGQTHRMLPTPPQPAPQLDPNQERRTSSPPMPPHLHTQPGMTTHYPRPMHNNNTVRVLDKYQEDWEVTDQLMEEIERADMQQLQQAQVPPHVMPQHMGPYPPSYTRDETVSPPKDPLVEKVRVTERASPKDIDLSSQRRQRDRERDQQAARESPKNRDLRQTSTSPTSAAFAAQNHAHTPENRGSPYHASHGSQGDYSQYVTHDSPAVGRRNTVSHQAQQQQQQQPSVASQTPPLQAISTRTPNRSLPVQEEAEDDVSMGSKNGSSSRDSWKSNEPVHLDQQRVESPDHSDLNSDDSGTRYEPNTHPSLNGSGVRVIDDKQRIISKEDIEEHRFGDRDHGGEDYTPRSPTSNLPESMLESFPPPPTTAVKVTARPRPRSGPTDQLGLRGLDVALMEQNGLPAMVRDVSPPSSNQDRQQQFSSHRKPVPDINDQMQQQQQLQQQQQHLHPSHAQQQLQFHQNYQRYDPRLSNNRHYIPDDLQNYPDDASVYFQSYIQSPRPDAPIPPTPHSQSAAPSPSPFISGNYDSHRNRDLPPFSPVAPVGSPYPYPFTHVRRNPVPNHSSNNQNHNHNQGPSNIDHNMLREQYARQWQIFAQNNNWGAMSDSTFSPAPTPFQGAYSPWAHWHTQRVFGRNPPDAVSMQSSPSHEPVPLPRVPHVGIKKDQGQSNERKASGLRHETSSTSPRKPPPRVESTQPRDTSPEPSSSGEETAGEDSYATPSTHFNVPGQGGQGQVGMYAYDERWMNAVLPLVGEEDDEADWVDEDEEVDPEDLLDLEYHPSYVRTSEKRRRRWELGWEALAQAFQNLDRQTDTTMVLVAAPADSTKLHIMSSRSIRRQLLVNRSPAMHQLKAGFRGIAHYRRHSRTRKVPIIDHILTQTSSSGDGSDGSSESREGDLRRALEAALNSLDVLKNMYEQREARWNDEMGRMHKDKENVEFLMKQLFGEKHVGGGSAVGGGGGLNGLLVSPTP